MKALLLEGIQQPIRQVNISIPELVAGEALVRVSAASFNRRDWWIQRGQYAGLKFPIVLGSDGAGIVEEICSSDPNDQRWLQKPVSILPSLGWYFDSDFQPSDFSILGLPQDGTFAEFVKVPIANIFSKPNHLNWIEAAAMPLAGLTAYRALFKKARLQRGEKILITGIGGGVATFGLQFALACGAEVYVTTSSSDKIQMAISKGATGGVLYTSNNWSEELRNKAGGFDVILDGALGEGFSEYLELANPGGRIVFYGGTAGNLPPLNGRKIFWKQLQILGTTMGSSVDFQNMLDFMKTHRIHPIIERVIKMEKAQEGLDLMTSSSQFGKIVMTIG